MRRIRALASVVAAHKPLVKSVKPNPVRVPTVAEPPPCPSLHLLPRRSPFCSSATGESRPLRIDEEEDESHSESDAEGEFDPHDVEAAVKILVARQPKLEMRQQLEKLTVKASPEMVAEVLNRVRNDWEAAYTFFVWAGERTNYSHSVRAYHNMISVLGKMRRFETAWSVISEMSQRSLVSRKTLRIMIRRYSAARDVGSAIATFQAHGRFGLETGMEEFQSLVGALCRYDKVREAEHLVVCSEKKFPLNTKSFNMVLSGWGGNMREVKRVWGDMKRLGVPHDEVSYSTLIACNSRRGNLDMVLRLFRRIPAPNRKVYNAVVFALAKAGMVDNAVELMRVMEERGVAPNSVTYNSVIAPLCRSGRVAEAGKAMDEMQRRNLSPTLRTHHAFLHAAGSTEEAFALLRGMRGGPHLDTYAMLLKKFCGWGEFEDVFKLWGEMQERGLRPDRSAYTALVHGLFLGGRLEQAHAYYLEMKEKGYVPQTKTEEMIQAWLAGNNQRPH